MCDRPGDVHDHERFRRACGRRGFFDDRDRLALAGVKTRGGERRDGHRPDAEEDESWSAHARRLTGTRRRA